MTNSRSPSLFSGVRGTAARVGAGMFGGFILASRLAALRHAPPGRGGGVEDANLWWIDLRAPPEVVTSGLLLIAGVRPDGTPSDALCDRVPAAAELIREGCAPRFVLSGGPGPGGGHEVDAMRPLPLDCGVPREAILEDRDGVSTGATVANTDRLLVEDGLTRVPCVSHFYPLPRIKMSFSQRGREGWTVPAPPRRRLAALPWYMAREAAAFGAYGGRSLA